ncbi:MAG TPA: EVE domain-containing protein [Polyangiales bacterium]
MAGKRAPGAGKGSGTAVRHWLMKSEPDAFSIDDLARLGRSPWDGVRNYQARNFMQQMRVGDLVLFYHSSCEPKGVVGVARVAKAAYADHTQFDPKSDHFDPASPPDAPRWFMVDVEMVEKLAQPFTLEAMKRDAKLADMIVVRKGSRLSVQPVESRHAQHILAQAGAKTR